MRTYTCPITEDGCSRVATPVCASNGVTYANECVMKQLSCQFNLDLHVIRDGMCSDR